MAHAFKIAIWNANGLAQHSLELNNFIKSHDLDIVLISETHFTNRNYLRIKNYTIYDTTHPSGNAHGGSAVIIKNSIKHHASNQYRTDHIQATNVVVEDWQGHLIVSAIYCPPRHAIKKEQFDAFFSTLGNRFLVGGDYNAKHTRWGSRLVTTRGRELLKCMDVNNYKHLSTGRPTYWPSDINKIPDLIDFCVTNGISPRKVAIEENLELSSDHSVLMVMLSSRLLNQPVPATLTNKKTDWEKFRYLIRERLTLDVSLKSAEDIDNAVENLTRAIQTAAWGSTPEIQQTTFTRPNCSEVVKEAVSEKRRLRRTWMITRAPQDKSRLNQATRNLKNLLQREKNQNIQEFLQDLTPTEATQYSLWKATRKLKNRDTEAIPPIRKADGTWARTDNDKATTFARHLEEVFQPHPSGLTAEEDEEIRTYLATPYQMSRPIQPIKTSEIKNHIAKNLNVKKAPGYDCITGKVIKELPDEALRYITYIFNGILRTGHFPSQWKVAQIILIPKPGKSPVEVTSYRPISLLPIMSKMFEKLFLKRLMPILEGRSIIPEHQFGFRERHGTVEQVHRLVKIINRTFENKEYCSAAFLDISQAFDRVWHQGLLFKLKSAIPHAHYRVLESYLQDRYFLVKFRNDVTKLHLIQAGVPQGSVLGPVLYQIYTADIPWNASNTVIATYADDTALLATSKNPTTASRRLQESLNSVQEWMRKWRVKANETKSTHVTFTLNRDTCPFVALNNTQLPQEQSAKYLGIHLDRRLTWQKHIFTKRKQLGLQFSKMQWLIGRQSPLSLETKLLVYKVILKPVWTYGVQLWGTSSASNLEILQRFQSKVLRTITDAQWFVTNATLHQDLQVLTVREEARNASSKYLARLELHPNPLAVNLLDNSTQTYRLKRLTPLDLS